MPAPVSVKVHDIILYHLKKVMSSLNGEPFQVRGHGTMLIGILLLQMPKILSS
jgi:hypothetical protein